MDKINFNGASLLDEELLKELGAADATSSILVGFSGGADSRTLLDLLVGFSRRYGTKIYAAHVNHGIRGAEADRDEEFCKSVASTYGIEIFTTTLDIPALSDKSGKSIELCARDERYAFFAKIMRGNNIRILATAHNANDNLETMLFNLSRGSGLSGLCGIPRSRECEGGMLVRPILSLSREEILAYCEKNSLDFVTDSTNGDVDYTRNKIRAMVVPVLKQISPAAEKRSVAAADILKRDEEFLSSLSSALLDEAKQNDGGLSLNVLLSAHSALSSRALMKLFKQTSGDSLEAVHVNDILTLACRAVPHSRLSLPNGFFAVIEGGALYLKVDAPEETYEPFETVARQGVNEISQINAKIIIAPSQEEKNIYKNSIQFKIDSATIDGVLALRSRRQGDRILMGGMHKSVKKLMCDKKVPIHLRDRLPLLCDGKGIIAIPLVGERDGARVNKSTRAEDILDVVVCIE